MNCVKPDQIIILGKCHRSFYYSTIDDIKSIDAYYYDKFIRNLQFDNNSVFINSIYLNDSANICNSNFI